MKFSVYNHKATADHKFQNVVIDSTRNPEAFTRMVFTACGEGINTRFTTKAIETNAQLLALLPGQTLRVTTAWLDLHLREREIDITLTRVAD
jgi:hypothetical protein